MNKTAGLLESLLPTIKQKLTSPEVQSIVSKEPLKFPSISKAIPLLGKFKIKSVDAPPSGSPSNVAAFVTTGDADKDGYIDTINIVSPKLEHLDKFHTLNGESLAHFLNYFSELILHEAAHLGGGKLKHDPKKPEGGLLPESSAQAAVPKPIIAKERKENMKKQAQAMKILKKLAKDVEDENLSSQIKNIINKVAQAPSPMPQMMETAQDAASKQRGMPPGQPHLRQTLTQQPLQAPGKPPIPQVAIDIDEEVGEVSEVTPTQENFRYFSDTITQQLNELGLNSSSLMQKLNDLANAGNLSYQIPSEIAAKASPALQKMIRSYVDFIIKNKPAGVRPATQQPGTRTPTTPVDTAVQIVGPAKGKDLRNSRKRQKEYDRQQRQKGAGIAATSSQQFQDDSLNKISDLKDLYSQVISTNKKTPFSR